MLLYLPQITMLPALGLHVGMCFPQNNEYDCDYGHDDDDDDDYYYLIVILLSLAITCLMSCLRSHIRQLKHK